MDNRTLAYNLNGVFDWNAQPQFLNLVKTMRPWVVSKPGVWNGFEAADIARYQDENGYLRQLPPGAENIKGIFSLSGSGARPEPKDVRAGRYVFRYSGLGSFKWKGVKTLSSEQGKIVIEIPPRPGNIWFEYSGIGSDYPHDMSLVREEFVEAYDQGKIFDLDWYEVIKDSCQLRFMDWMHTNNSKLRFYADYPTPEDYSWSQGVPVKIMCELANQLNADPWFTIPHLANDTFVLRFAEDVKQYLSTNLKPYVEYSNELWNWPFKQAKYLHRKGEEFWGEKMIGEYYVAKSTKIIQLARSVLGSRMVAVVGGQTAYYGMTNGVLSASSWKKNEAKSIGEFGKWVDPAETFDALAVTSYFGSMSDWQKANSSRIAGMSQQQAINELTRASRDPSLETSLPDLRKNLSSLKALTKSKGLDLILYEGGQHWHHHAKSITDNQQYSDHVAAFVRSPEMAELYEEQFEIVKEFVDGPYMQFTEFGNVNKYGSWGLRVNVLDNPPRALKLKELAEQNSPWWVDERPPVEEPEPTPEPTPVPAPTPEPSPEPEPIEEPIPEEPEEVDPKPEPEEPKQDKLTLPLGKLFYTEKDGRKIYGPYEEIYKEREQ